jgi:hypothetical protein
MELTGGQLATGEPLGQLAGVVGRISSVSGGKVQEDKLGSPEQDSVTNIGAVSAELSSGVIVTAIVPALPPVRVSGSVEGATGASETAKLGVALVVPVTFAVSDREPTCDASPLYTARRA